MKKLSFALIFLLIAAGANAQTKNRLQKNTVDNQNKNKTYITFTGKAVSELQRQLNLSEDQAEDISQVLYNYHKRLLEKPLDKVDDTPADTTDVDKESKNFRETAAILKTNANRDIEDILNKEQKIKWADLKADWWKYVDETIASHRQQKEKINNGK